jgi:hypothetical protein
MSPDSPISSSSWKAKTKSGQLPLSWGLPSTVATAIAPAPLTYLNVAAMCGTKRASSPRATLHLRPASETQLLSAATRSSWGMLTNGYGKRSDAAYVFEREQGRWLEVARLLPEVQR